MFSNTHKKQIQVGLLLVVGLYFLNTARTPEAWRFLDGVDLIIHEAGHVVFIFFGRFLEIAGGSVFQILVPVVFVVAFFLQRKYLSATFVLFWVGQSIINVSVYARDAALMKLPLLGGSHVIHDWNYLLTQLNLLSHAQTIGLVLETLGVMVYFCAIALGLYILFYKKEY